MLSKIHEHVHNLWRIFQNLIIADQRKEGNYVMCSKTIAKIFSGVTFLYFNYDICLFCICKVWDPQIYVKILRPYDKLQRG